MHSIVDCVFTALERISFRPLYQFSIFFYYIPGHTSCSGSARFRALQLDPASRVAPLDKLSIHLVILFAWLLLGEKLTPPALIGGLLITAGAVVIALG